MQPKLTKPSVGPDALLSVGSRAEDSSLDMFGREPFVSLPNLPLHFTGKNGAIPLGLPPSDRGKKNYSVRA